MTEEELLALLKGISGTKPPSPKLTATKKPADDDCYMAPSAEEVIAGTASASPEELVLGGSGAEAASKPSPSTGLAQRFTAKAWKDRQGAYNEAKALVEGGCEATAREIATHLSTAADDSNASANDSALEMITAW